MSRLVIQVFLNRILKFHGRRWAKASALAVMPFWADNDKTKTLHGIIIWTKCDGLNTGRIESGILPENALLMMAHKAAGQNLRDRNDEGFQGSGVL
jgi:hypothetical protein